MSSFHGAGEWSECLSRCSWLDDRMEKPPVFTLVEESAQSQGNNTAKSIGLLLYRTGDVNVLKSPGQQATWLHLVLL